MNSSKSTYEEPCEGCKDVEFKISVTVSELDKFGLYGPLLAFYDSSRQVERIIQSIESNKKTLIFKDQDKKLAEKLFFKLGDAGFRVHLEKSSLK